MKYAKWMKNVGEGFIGEMLRAAQNPEMISFAGGLPALDLFPTQDLQAAFQKVFEEQGNAALQYAQTAGYPELRSWVASQHQRSQRPARTAEVIITTGSQQGLSLLAQTFLDPGDTVFLETPTYLGAIQAFEGFRADFQMIPCDEEGILPDELEKALAFATPKFLYLIPNYQNPSGRVMGLERRIELLKVSQKYGLLLVEDNPYGELRYEGEPIPHLAELGENVIYLGTFSKVLAPGLRIGYVLADEDIIRHLEQTKEGVDLHSNNLTQRAIYEYLQKDLLPDHILKLREVYNVRRKAMVESLQTYLGDRVEMKVPAGGLFLWAKLMGVNNSFDYVQDMIRQNVLYVPGAVFYADGRVSNEMRLNYSCSTPEIIEEGMMRLARGLNQ
ncbi:PLP-dependent aminotransferase family protein [Desulfitobacterium chlororespirans]|uniref:Aromatic amino acid aminotransferase apoenzyme n=1 Tax=Desulfitobacterium chlororespirans DSM 11544 TaxID=1121395 RepID=A0A1M7UPU1_9FIRM|nr:PLP-dependent aminotransferase family protein [Desulfitobacterium chlororespirans]SHN84916.1 aromatic amino acid aminotransferase apoenzyme [Desulfitobacterium chlororespirans DSM 11544]